jgi:valyl-tRNA synthetase
LANERFVLKAPAQKIEEERQKLAEYRRQHEMTAQKLQTLR